MNVSEESQKIIDESPHKKDLEDVLEKISHWLTQEKIVPTSLQWTILTNHVNEMIRRKMTGEHVVSVDPAMFSEVSEEALNISKKVVTHIGHLPEDEVYLLSIHFETAKQNEQ